MKKNFIFFLISTFFFSCAGTKIDIEKECKLETELIREKVTLENPVEINMLNSGEDRLYFRIIPLEIGHACTVQPSDSVQIMDNSTYGYPDALKLDELIAEDNNWSDKGNFVLGTSVGHGGQFEGAGVRYLGFRVINNGEYEYGWISIDNNEGNTSVNIDSYAIKKICGDSILSGEGRKEP